MERQEKKYQKLNQFAIQNGVVVFGEGTDVDIPTSELAQSFNLDYPIYNRSIFSLNLDNAITIYNSCVNALKPNTLLIRLGINDVDLFNNDKASFEKKYITLIEHIKKSNKNCRLVLVSVDNKDVNQELKHVADSTRCEFGNLSSINGYNPQTTKTITSFIQDMNVKRYYKSQPIYDLLKIIYCF